MCDATAYGILLILVGGLSLAFAVMAILADHVFPALARHGWRARKIRQRIAAITGQRPAGRYVRR